MDVGNKKTNMNDIARAVGVSKTIVSRALSDKYGVSVDMRAKIMVAAHEMQYNFGKIAKTKVKRVSLIVTSNALLQDEYWRSIILGIEDAVICEGYVLEILLYSVATTKSELMQKVAASNSKGIFFVSDFDEKFIEEFSSLNIPIVIIDSMFYVGLKHSQVRASNYLSGYNVAEYLIKKGHKHVGYYGDIAYSLSTMLRYHGFSDAVNKSGDIKITPIISKSEINKPYSEENFIRIFKREDYPTAIFCGSDEIAYNAYELLAKLDICIPSDVSVVGFDNFEKSKWIHPPLTTIDVDKKKIGQIAFKLLLEEIQDVKCYIKIVDVPSLLIERESVK